MTKKSNTSEDKRIEEEKKSLKQAFNTIPEEKQSIADKLIDRLAFMTITLQIFFVPLSKTTFKNFVTVKYIDNSSGTSLC